MGRLAVLVHLVLQDQMVHRERLVMPERLELKGQEELMADLDHKGSQVCQLE